MSKIVQNIGVVSQTGQLQFADLQRMVAAVEIQMVRDRYPAWGRETHVVAFKDAKSIPHHFWPAFIRDDIGEPGAAGYHTDENNQPVIFCQWNGFNETAITLSHECLETAQDSQGNRLIAVSLPKIGPVKMLAEIADPPEAKSYLIGNVPVSDFLLPAWYGYDAQDPPGSKLTHMGTITQPLTLIRGGYMSYLRPDGSWEQQTWFSGRKPKVVKLGREDSRDPDESLREWIDRITSRRK